ncbi:SGNH/GDSL hydrolase family protein [Nocardia sp. N13]|uniref:SGNH/GDSL hydrolase family protein n=1 Tax=Nocardioides sp. N13(2025) TaxID=3453405 RepID=UPI003F7671B4
MTRVVLLGDSHLARVRRDLPALGPDVCNAAEGGASSLDLLAQATRAAVEEDDLVVVSVGTNDAAPWKQVPVTAFAQAVTRCLHSVPARRWVYVAPPGVDESRLTGPGDRTNAVLDGYRDAAVSACVEAGARVVRTERIIGPLGAGAFVGDGLHLSGRAYRVLLPAIAEAVHGRPGGPQTSIQW